MVFPFVGFPLQFEGLDGRGPFPLLADTSQLISPIGQEIFGV